MPATVPLGILDLVPIPSGSTAAEALRSTVDLARQAEQFGYARYWFAEHHLNPGVAGSSPAVVVALTASATTSIRVGSGAVQLGHRTALSTVEEFGLLDAAHPGRIDLGLGRSAGGPPPPQRPAGEPARAYTTENGLRIPEPFSFAHLRGHPRVALQHRLLHLPGAESEEYSGQVGDVLALLRGEYRSPEGVAAHAVPGEGAEVEVWVLGSSGGVSAETAGAGGLRFAANYHVSPSNVLEAASAYREAFKPSAGPGGLDRPYLSVSADVVVAPSDAEARELAAGYAPWVHSIRTAEGAIPFPSPAEARELVRGWSAADHKLVADRVETQFAGSPTTVADQLERLRDATGADELLITTITHDHADRVRSYRLLAGEWARRGYLA